MHHVWNALRGAPHLIPTARCRRVATRCRRTASSFAGRYGHPTAKPAPAPLARARRCTRPHGRFGAASRRLLSRGSWQPFHTRAPSLAPGLWSPRWGGPPSAPTDLALQHGWRRSCSDQRSRPRRPTLLGQAASPAAAQAPRLEHTLHCSTAACWCWMTVATPAAAKIASIPAAPPPPRASGRVGRNQRATPSRGR
eukprot:7377096-Prymnesium_polylepis.1